MFSKRNKSLRVLVTMLLSTLLVSLGFAETTMVISETVAVT